ncbi:DNA internalization-related competence protein ComEC/Rec2 [Lawsonibacter hominis]|uniref:DNA internalization-related competence protein ComEC/Rec2 n=1 Tax=Lawsonibacter hominis TaxID=2763053 RepID=UPI00350F7ACF
MAVRVCPEEGGSVKTQLYLAAGKDGSLPALRPGDRLTFSGRFRLADTVAGEESEYYHARGITLIAYADGGATAVIRPERIPPRYWPAWIAKALKDSVRRCFPDSAAPLAAALITGDRSGLPGALYSALRRSGIAHVVAVSGLHVSVLSGLLAVLLGRRRHSAVAGILLVFFFAAVAGDSPSVLRAAFMQSMLLLAPLLGRENDTPTSLCAILLLLLVHNPYAAASVSLQLSFAAVAGICLFTGRLWERWDGKLPRKGLGGKALRFAAASLATTLGAVVFTTPLSAYYFGSLSLIAPVTNLLTLWAVSGAFLGALAVALLGLLFPAAAALAAWAAALPVWYLQKMAELLSRLPFASVGTDSIYLRLWLLLGYALLLLWLFWRGEQKRMLLPVGAGGLCLCAALLLTAASRTSGRLSVSVLDVGQGQSVVLYSQGRCALVDCGGSGLSDPGDTAADYLQSLGTARLDLLVLTHYHTDHACGVPQLLERLEVERLLLPDVEPEEPLRREIEAAAQAHGVELVYLTQDAHVTLGGASLRVYAPLGDGGANEEGLSVLCTAGAFDALITGDMNAAVERRLIKYGALPDLELLVAGHHGSKYATSEELLLATTPERAVLSVGYNTYGHPADETLERLAAAGCEIYRTDWMGTVRITAE